MNGDGVGWLSCAIGAPSSPSMAGVAGFLCQVAAHRRALRAVLPTLRPADEVGDQPLTWPLCQTLLNYVAPLRSRRNKRRSPNSCVRPRWEGFYPHQRSEQTDHWPTVPLVSKSTPSIERFSAFARLLIYSFKAPWRKTRRVVRAEGIIDAIKSELTTCVKRLRCRR
jgi:hypothetical protein